MFLSTGLLLAVGTVGALQAGDGPAVDLPAADPLVPDSVLALPQGPTLVLERAAGLAVAGLRISAPVEPGWHGVARALVDQALERTRAQATAIGASLRGGVEDGRIAYQVVGDLRDVDELAWIARRLASLPADEGSGAALAREEARLDRLAETPQGRLVLELTESWSKDGGERRLPVVGANEVRELWRRSHARDRLRVFVLGDVPVPWLLADLSRLGAPPLEAADRGDRSGLAGLAASGSRPASPPKTPLYAWSAATFSFGRTGDPVATAAVEALRAGLAKLAVPGAVLRLHASREGADGSLGITSRAWREDAADAALAAALAVATEEGLEPWWRVGVDEARRRLATAVGTPDGWLALADRYFSPDSRDAAAWPRGALKRLDSLTTADLAVALDRLGKTLSRPRIDG